MLTNKWMKENTWDFVWKMRDSGDYFVMPSKYFDCVNYTVLPDRDQPIFCGATGSGNIHRSDLFVLMFALLNRNAAKHVKYYTRAYELMNAKEYDETR